MFYMVGYASVAIIRLKNNSNENIDLVEFFYESTQKYSTTFKKIKTSKIKQTGLSTIKANNCPLQMIVNGKKYIIKDNLSRNYKGTLIVTINSIDENNCTYEVNEE